MSDEMQVQTKGLNKKFLFIAIALIAVGLVAALVLLLPTSAKAKKVEEQLDLGAKYLSELDYEQAIVAYEAVIKIDPKCEEAYLVLADIYIATGEFDKAEEILKQAEEAIGADVTASVEAKKQEVEEVREEKKAEEVLSPIPSPTAIPTPEPTATPTSTPSPIPSPTELPTSTPTPAAHTIYEGTTVELSKAKVGDVVLFGSYEQDNIASNGAEAIPWYVLDKGGDELLLMSVYLLDCVKYHEKYTSITWEDCTLRQWMNDEFYNSAFTKSEKKQIQTSYLKNEDNPSYGTEGGNDTEDKVFALSLAEAEQYFGIAEDKGYYWYSASPELSAAKVTAYAEAQGVWVSDYESSAGNGVWWLRSSDYASIASGVNDDGYVYVNCSSVVDSYAARPALWLNLNPSATTPAPTNTPSPIPSPTALPTPAAHTIYEGTTVELSKAKVGDVVLFGSYEQDNIASNGAEAIPWYVLDKDEDKLLLMSVYLLDCVKYHEKYTSITWEECTLRQWMNDEFYNSAFTKSEKKYIQTSYLKNEDNPYYGTEGGIDTEDKVFALSLAEAEQYFGMAEKGGYWWHSASPELSAAKVTAYAEAQGAYVSDYESSAGNGVWWLRSPSSYGSGAAYVYDVGNVGVLGHDVDFNSLAARPTMWLNLNP